VVEAIVSDLNWAPDYHAPVVSKQLDRRPLPERRPAYADDQEAEEAEDGAGAAAEPTEELQRAGSMVELTRTLSHNTQSNKEELVGWLDVQSTKWANGEKPTPADFAEGHMMVYTICSDSSSPKNAEASCYILYCDYVRGCVTQFPGEAEQKAGIKALQTVFR